MDDRVPSVSQSDYEHVQTVLPTRTLKLTSRHRTAAIGLVSLVP